MDYELVLENHYERIARDLDVYEIEQYIKDLKDNDILSEREVRDILNRGDSNDDNPIRAKRLLDLFRRRLQSQIPGFIKQLENSYPHLSEDFISDLQKIRKIDLPTTKKQIRRVACLRDIVNHFRLQSGFVVLLGMSGTGKTNLAVEVAMYFALQKSVYWINAGGNTGSQLKVLRMLLNKVNPKQEDPDSQSDPQQLLRKLKESLTAKDLVILDNVTPEVDLSLFSSLPPDFLITTTDAGITENLDSHVKIDMNNGFSSEETLELISKVVKKDVQCLPHCVRNIYKYFKGYPLAVSLIASQLPHCHPNRWDEFCQFSNDVDNTAQRRSSDVIRMSFDSTMQKCISSLSEETRKYYKMLAIFKDNVFLTTETLEVLWDCVSDIKKVRNILNELEDKSMVIKNFKVALETDVYEVHSTLLNYLRQLQTADDIKEIHQNFINRYVEIYGKIANIPDDHYIFYYVIYHITSAGYLEKFKPELFDLDYILAKLVACGPNDMAEDLKLYKNDLEKADFDKRRLEEASEFSERFGWDIYHTKVKDLQFFVQMPEGGLLFKEAMERCKEQNNLVFKSKWQTQRIITKEYPFQSVVKKLYCLEQNEILCEKWTNGTPKIVVVKLGDVKETFIADGSILCMCPVTGNVLYKDKDSAFLKQVGGGRTPDATRQLNGDRSFFKEASLGRQIHEIERVMIAAFSQSGDKIVFASNAEKGVYDLGKGTVELIPKSIDDPVPTPTLCCFCYVHHSEILMYATMARRIYFYETATLRLITAFRPVSNIIDITPIPNKRQLLVLTELRVEILSWEHGPQTVWTNPNRDLTIGNLSERVIYEGPKKCIKAFATDRWIAIATDDGCLVKPIMGEEFFNVGYGEVAALDVSENTLTVITTQGRPCKEFGVGGDDVRRITVYDKLDLERNRHRPYLKDACQLWPIQKGYLLAIVQPGNVVFYNDKSETFQTEIQEAITVDMSQMGDIAVVGDAHGNVHHILPFKAKKVAKVTQVNGSVDFLKINSSGEFIVAGCVNSSSPTITIISSRTVVQTDNVRYPIFDCFFEEETIGGQKPIIKPDPIVKIILLFKNGVHAVYDSATNKYRLGDDYQEHKSLSCAAYQHKMLIKGIERSLHVINFKKAKQYDRSDEPEKSHKSKDFGHRITNCCLEPVESATTADSTKPWVAVALATDDRRFQIVVCTKDLNEIRRIYVDYAQEEIQQLVFSRSQKILMARCDWLCFWDVSCDTNSPGTKSSRSTLHPAWKTHPTRLDKDQLVARFKLQLEVLSLLPSEDFGTFAVVHKKGDRRFLSVVDYDEPDKIPRNGSFPTLPLTLKLKNGSL